MTDYNGNILSTGGSLTPEQEEKLNTINTDGTTTQIVSEQLVISDPIIIVNDESNPAIPNQISGLACKKQNGKFDSILNIGDDGWVFSKDNTNHDDVGIQYSKVSAADFQTTTHIGGINQPITNSINHIADTANPHSITKADIGLADVLNLKHAVSSGTPPATADISTGYSVGSYWVDTANDRSYMCVDNTDNAAIWKEITEKNKSSSFGIDPSLNNDFNEGYRVNSLWTNTQTDNVFVCVNATVGAAIWKNITSGEIDDNSIAASKLWSSFKTNLEINNIINDSVISVDSGWSSSFLNTELNGKAATNHTHLVANITDFDTEVANNASVLANTNHINDDTKHRIINDTSTSATELWSSNKISTEISNSIIGGTPDSLNLLGSFIPDVPGVSLTLIKMTISGRFMFITAHDNQSPFHGYLFVVNIDDEENPVQIKTLEYEAGGLPATAQDISVVGSYLLITIVNVGLKIYDISDPKILTLAHEINVGSGRYVPVLVSNYLYVLAVFAGGQNGLHTYRLEKGVLNPVETDFQPFTGFEMIVNNKNYIMCGDATATYRLFNVSNQATPVALGLKTVGGIINGGEATIQGCCMYIKYVLAGNQYYLGKVDISDPENPSDPFTIIYNSPKALGMFIMGEQIVIGTKSGFRILNQKDFTTLASTGSDVYIQALPFLADVIYAMNQTAKSIEVWNSNGAINSSFIQSGVLESGVLSTRTDINVARDANVKNNLYVGNSLSVINNSAFQGNISVVGDAEFKNDIIVQAGSRIRSTNDSVCFNTAGNESCFDGFGLTQYGGSFRNLDPAGRLEINTIGSATSSDLTIGATTNTQNLILSKIGQQTIIQGDLIVNGDSITQNVSEVLIEDPLIKLANGNTTGNLNLGVFGQWNDGGGNLYTGFIKDKNTGSWHFFDNMSSEPTNTGNITFSNETAQLKIDGDLEARYISSKYRRTNVITPTYSILTTDEIIGCDTSVNSITLTLPTAEKKYYIVDESGNASTNNITVNTTGGDTINNNANLVMNVNNQSISLYYDGTSNWVIF